MTVRGTFLATGLRRALEAVNSRLQFKLRHYALATQTCCARRGLGAQWEVPSLPALAARVAEDGCIEGWEKLPAC
jgi:hypothetical protein